MRASRAGYTLLEILLALAIAVLVMGAVYSVIGYQLRHAQAGREIIERVTLARSLSNRLSTDISAALAQCDPARFRNAGTSETGGGGEAAGPSSAAAGGASGTSPSGTSASGTSGAGASSTGSATPPDASSESDATTEAGGLEMPIDLPLGVVGSSSELHLFISRVPLEIYGDGAEQGGQLTSDLRRVSYWLGGEDAGLCRLEARLITSEDGTNPDLPTGDVSSYVLAPEVRSIEFSYFDGTDWADSWDSTAPGPDGTTPLGSPRAVAIRIGVVGRPGAEEELRYSRHVVALPTAGGTPQSATTPMEGGTSP